LSIKRILIFFYCTKLFIRITLNFWGYVGLGLCFRYYPLNLITIIKIARLECFDEIYLLIYSFSNPLLTKE
jgi:hypothetical protein